MSIRTLLPLFSGLLLVACASEPTQQPPQVPAKPSATRAPLAVPEAPLPAHMRELRGNLRTPPPGSEVEIALLVVDERDRPQQLLASLALAGNGQLLPFRMPFNPTYFPQGARVELRARISQSGRLIQRLAPRRIFQAQTQNLGELPLISAP